ncbi:hypothetical protein CBR_g38972 [Chara braunii]|uniref:Reverse transcriptase domain-containing protein n=1 Tax=Chara braunii TaxID=69332 RepID=A0A388K0R9_CHABU|nr:hypothetical protein CBR_g38972 [Chara braunii]|eukprot:GBG63660.1 hypothetical protein CBR_g38972 [Chara braunii]
MEEKRRKEEEHKAKEEEEVRRNQDFARKAEEFKLQLRTELMEEWRRTTAEATMAMEKTRKPRKIKVPIRVVKSKRKGKQQKRRRKKGRETSDEDTEEESDTNEESTDSTTSESDSEPRQARRKARTGRQKKRPTSRRASTKGKGGLGIPHPEFMNLASARGNGSRDRRRGACRRDLKVTTVEFASGQEWMEGWRRLRRRFGDSTMEIGEENTLLRHAKLKLQQGGEVVLKKIVKAKTTTERNKTMLTAMLKRPRPDTQMITLPTKKLIGLYRTVGLFSKKQTKHRLRTKLDRIIAQKTGVSVRKRVNIKMLFDSRIRKAGVGETAEDFVANLVKDKPLADFVKTRIRVLWLRNKNVGELIHNQKKYASVKEHPCPCEGRLLPKTEGRILSRFSDMEVPDFVRNAKNVTRPAKAGETQTIAKAIFEATRHLKCRKLPEVKPGVVFTGRLIGAVAWTDEDVRKWAKQFDGLVLSPIDRNQGDTAVMCPVLYRHGFERLEATTQRFRAAGCETAVGRCYDIKEMFSRIPHGAVEQAVHQLLKIYEDKGCKQIRVSLQGKQGVISDNKRKMDGYVSLTLKLVMAGIRYDLRHSVVRCGDKLVKQIFGIPMGKSTSPILASITCAMAELRFIQELSADKRLIGGWRVIDDITIMAGIPKDTKNEDYPDNLFDGFEEVYDRNLDIIRKDECGLTWQFVGEQMMICSEPLQIHYVTSTKNTDSLHMMGKLTFQTMQDFGSYTAKSVKRVVLTTILKRLWHHTTNKELVIGEIGYAICEANLQGYPPEVSLGALAQLAKAVPNLALHCLLAAFTSTAGWAKQRRSGKTEIASRVGSSFRE